MKNVLLNPLQLMSKLECEMVIPLIHTAYITSALTYCSGFHGKQESVQLFMSLTAPQRQRDIA